MRTGLAYTAARILILVVALALLSLAGARGFLLLALAFVVSALASYVLLSKQRETMAGALNRRLSKATSKVTGAEDDDADEEQPAGLRQQENTAS